MIIIEKVEVATVFRQGFLQQRGQVFSACSNIDIAAAQVCILIDIYKHCNCYLQASVKEAQDLVLLV